MSLMKSLQLSLLRGRDQALHTQIAAAYAKGDYAAGLRAEQRKVRAAITNIEQELR
jgi:hypothetical protein